MRARVLVAAAVAFLETAASNPPAVLYAPAPAWAAPPPATTGTTPLPGAPVRVSYYDQQIRVGPSGTDTFTTWRIKVLTPQALQIGNIGLEWSPGWQTITVHSLRILRDGKVIDVLAGQRFDVIQREANLEKAMLDGVRTATLQTAGLQVGDELAFAMTLHEADANLGGNAQGFAQLPPLTTQGAFRVRALWPSSRPLRWGGTPDLPPPTAVTKGAEQSVTIELADPATVVSPDGAPPRYAVHRLFQYSTFPSWGAVSHQLWPLFDAAAQLQPGSPVRAEVARIAALSPDPARRAEAALQLVQDRIRYVYVGLDRANYRPAAADDTWTRRFGDCKAKTALLLAILRELAITAEPVLVSTTGGDGTDQRLPTTQVFDHVLVRATIAGRPYWLDGTRAGDRSLAAIPAPAFRWDLPLRAGDAALEPVKPVPLALPQSVLALDIDASAGFDKPATVHATQVIRGDEAYPLRTGLSALAPADLDRALRAWWKDAADWVEPRATAWRVRDGDDAVVLTLTGTGKPGWEGDAKGHTLSIAGAGFTPPAEMKRAADQDQQAPWALEFPRYRCWATTIHLPAAGANLRWAYRAAPVDRRFAGADYYREALLERGVMHTVMSRRAVVPEISANEATRVNADLPRFDNNISQVFEAPAYTTLAQPGAGFLGKPIDWTSPDAPCRPAGSP